MASLCPYAPLWLPRGALAEEPALELELALCLCLQLRLQLRLLRLLPWLQLRPQ